MRITSIFSLLLTLMACSNASVLENNSSSVGKQPASESQKYLAYKHNVTIDLAKETIESTFTSVVNMCNESDDYACTLLDSQINNGSYTSASIRMRIKKKALNLYYLSQQKRERSRAKELMLKI
jgi:hypothetical protein